MIRNLLCREVAGIAIPLVRVFEVRDVDWARPVMAALTICVVCLPLTEIMPSLYNLLVKLAGRDWKVLASPILYRNAFTGAPVLAIFTAGMFSPRAQKPFHNRANKRPID